MLKRIMWGVPFLALALPAGTCFAQTQTQSPEEPKFYKLEFVVKEVEGSKVLNARTYSMVVSTGKDNSSIRTGSRVPVQTTASSGTSPASSSSFQYIDVGVNVDCRMIKEVQHSLSLFISTDISSVPPESLTPGAPSHPVVRQNRWSSNVVVPIKKPTVIFTADDTTTKRQLQLELTAVPVLQL